MREWIFLVLAPLATACTPQGQCETTPPYVEYCGMGDPNCRGHIIDATHWESGPSDGNFLPYGAEQVYHMQYRDAVTGDLLTGQRVFTEVEVGAVQKADTPGNSFILGTNELSELTDDAPIGSALYVKNGTCGSYFVRVIVTIIPSAPVSDGGTEAEASTDAGTE